MFRILLVLFGLSIPSFSQESQRQIDELRRELAHQAAITAQQGATIAQQAETIQAHTKTISHLEHLIAHDHRTQPTFRKIVPDDKILGTSIILAMICAYSTFINTGSIVLTCAAIPSYFWTFYGFLKIVRNSATVAGNSPLVAKATRD